MLKLFFFFFFKQFKICKGNQMKLHTNTHAHTPQLKQNAVEQNQKPKPIHFLLIL